MPIFCRVGASRGHDQHPFCFRQWLASGGHCVKQAEVASQEQVGMMSSSGCGALFRTLWTTSVGNGCFHAKVATGVEQQ